ncbi:MAG: beta-lactamase domain protein [Solirubrobacteraceae bacterium]|nr:beta-lactamase domain protein [Solirubrobacteraceae bacterium]
MALSAQATPIPVPLPGGSDGAVVGLHPLVTAEMLAPPRFFERPEGPLWLLRGLGLTASDADRHVLPIPAFLIEHPTAGAILVDTGLHADVAGDPVGNLGRRTSGMTKIRMRAEQAVPAQLKARGIEPGDIAFVVMTHMHYDHASGVSQFPGATFVVDRSEWEAFGAGGFLQGYRHALADHPVQWRTVDVVADGAPLGPFPHALDLLGDGSIQLLETPGHSRGHRSVLLRTAAGAVLLTGDAAYTARTIERRWVPLFIDDVPQYLRSLETIAEWAEEHPAAPVLCGHDPWSDGLQRSY